MVDPGFQLFKTAAEGLAGCARGEFTAEELHWHAKHDLDPCQACGKPTGQSAEQITKNCQENHRGVNECDELPCYLEVTCLCDADCSVCTAPPPEIVAKMMTLARDPAKWQEAMQQVR